MASRVSEIVALREEIRRLRVTEANCARAKDWDGAQRAEDACTALEASVHTILREEMQRLQEQEVECVKAKNWTHAKQIKAELAALEALSDQEILSSAAQSAAATVVPVNNPAPPQPSPRQELTTALLPHGTNETRLSPSASATRQSGSFLSGMRAMMGSSSASVISKQMQMSDAEVDAASLETAIVADRDRRAKNTSDKNIAPMELYLAAEARLASLLQARADAVALVREHQKPTMVEQDTTALRDALKAAVVTGVSHRTYTLDGERGSDFVDAAHRWVEQVDVARASAEHQLQVGVASEPADVDASALKSVGIDAAQACGLRDHLLITRAIAKLNKVEAARVAAEQRLRKSWSTSMAEQDIPALQSALSYAQESGVGKASHILSTGELGSDLLARGSEWLRRVTTARNEAEAAMRAGVEARGSVLDVEGLNAEGVAAARVAGVQDEELIAAAKARVEEVRSARNSAARLVKQSLSPTIAEQAIPPLDIALQQAARAGLGQPDASDEHRTLMARASSWMLEVQQARESVLSVLTAALETDFAELNAVAVRTYGLRRAASAGVHDNELISRVRSKLEQVAFERSRAAQALLAALREAEVDREDGSAVQSALGRALSSGIGDSSHMLENGEPGALLIESAKAWLEERNLAVPEPSPARADTFATVESGQVVVVDQHACDLAASSSAPVRPILQAPSARLISPGAQSDASPAEPAGTPPPVSSSHRSTSAPRQTSTAKTAAAIRAVIAQADEEIDLDSLRSLCTKAHEEVKREALPEGGRSDTSPDEGASLDEIRRAEIRVAVVENKRAKAVRELHAVWLRVKGWPREESNDEDVASLHSALEAARQVGVGLPYYHKLLVKEVAAWLDGYKPLTTRLSKKLGSIASSARSSLGMTSTARIQSTMAAPDSGVDVYALRELCRKARAERQAEEQKPASKALDTLLPVAELEAAEARAEALDAKRAEVALALDPYVGDNAPTMAALDVEALGKVLDTARACGVAHKAHLRTDGSRSKELFQACNKLLTETKQARADVNKLLETDLACMPEKLNCVAMKAKGLDRALETGGVLAELLEKAKKWHTQVQLCVSNGTAPILSACLLIPSHCSCAPIPPVCSHPI